MKVIIAADHAGFVYKQLLVADLKQAGYDVTDLGGDGTNPQDDYPDYASAAATALLNKEGDRAILICGSAVGVSIAANKFPGIRAGVCNDTYTAHQCVEHDHVNILCLGQRVTGVEVVREIAFTYLTANFTGEERHKRRLAKIEVLEHQNLKEKLS